jgi:hypothetical protein
MELPTQVPRLIGIAAGMGTHYLVSWLAISALLITMCGKCRPSTPCLSGKRKFKSGLRRPGEHNHSGRTPLRAARNHLVRKRSFVRLHHAGL